MRLITHYGIISIIALLLSCPLACEGRNDGMHLSFSDVATSEDFINIVAGTAVLGNQAVYITNGATLYFDLAVYLPGTSLNEIVKSIEEDMIEQTNSLFNPFLYVHRGNIITFLGDRSYYYDNARISSWQLKALFERLDGEADMPEGYNHPLFLAIPKSISANDILDLINTIGRYSKRRYIYLLVVNETAAIIDGRRNSQTKQ